MRAAIIQVVGAGSRQSFDIEQSRYHKIIMMTDADVDGAHPYPVADAVLPVHAAAYRLRLRVCRSTAAAPHRVDRLAQGRIHLHVFR